MWDSPALWVAVCGLLLNLLVTVIGGVWKLSRMEIALRDAIDRSNKEIDERIERQVRYFGEVVAAVRQKIADVELYARDTFVRKDEIKSDLKQLGESIDARLTRIEDKLDKGA